MKICKKCGSNIPQYTNFCDNCGEPTGSAKNWCVECGEQLDGDDSSYCNKCLIERKKNRKNPLMFLVPVLIVLAIAVAYWYFTSTVREPKSGVTYGFEVSLPDGGKPSQQETNLVASTIADRLYSVGCRTYSVTPSVGEGKITVLLESAFGEKLEEVLSIIEPGTIKFAVVSKEFNHLTADELNRELKKGSNVVGPTLIEVDSVADAESMYGGQVSQQPIVELTLNDDGAKRFEQITAQNVNKRLAIMLDDHIITAPNIEQKITGGKAVVEGMKSINEAKIIELIAEHPISMDLRIIDRHRFP